MDNPGVPGTHTSTQFVYASPDLDYPTAPPPTGFEEQYSAFENPSSLFSTGTVDLSDFVEFDARYPWPFNNQRVPLNGIVRVPTGQGPFPLAVFVHGNHDAFENSTPGYLYLCEHLASHGIIAATIDSNFTNGWNFGENESRALVILEHIRQFRTWNATPSHPLQNKIDLSKVLICGHSRGGEAVGHASVINRLSSITADPTSFPTPLDGSAGLGPYNFGLRAVIAIAPTDLQYIPVDGPKGVRDNFLILHGSRDGDVSQFQGYATYDRSHAVLPSSPTQPAEGYKSLLWIHRAIHNFFNSVWKSEWLAPDGSNQGPDTLNRETQERIAKLYIGAIALAELRGQHHYRRLLRDHRVAFDENWLANNITLVSQYQDRKRIMVQHFQESGPSISVSAPVQGTVSQINLDQVDELRFNLARGSHLSQETKGLRIQWSQAGEYQIDVDPVSLTIDDYTHFGLRIGQSFESQNTPGNEQNLTIVFEDDAASASFSLSSFGSLHFPDVFQQELMRTEPLTVMQSIRIPLSQINDAGVHTSGIRRIRLVFDQTNTGIVYLDDIQFSN